MGLTEFFRKPKPEPEREYACDFPFYGLGTVMIFTVVGLYPVGGKMTAEELVQKINQILQTVYRCISRNNHPYLDFIPGSASASAVLGPANINPGHASQALKTAREILEECVSLETPTVALKAHLALATGDMGIEAVANRLQILGRPFNQAKELMALGNPERSQVLFTGETLEHATEPWVGDVVAHIPGEQGVAIPVYSMTI